jgi:hypothetical protein
VTAFFVFLVVAIPGWPSRSRTHVVCVPELGGVHRSQRRGLHAWNPQSLRADLASLGP